MSPPSPSFTLAAHGIARALGDRTLFAGLDLVVAPGDRIGVVGPNGIGKSTLLRTLAGLERPDRGRVSRRPGDLTVGYLPQLFTELADRSGETVRQLLERRLGVADADLAVAAASEELARGEPGADDRYAAALARFLTLGGADLDARFDAVATDLGLSALVLEQSTTTLSGGQAARVSLAAVLLARHDVVLLDEPTNDVDFAGLDRLEQAVRDHRGAVVVVSHDRAFLEAVVADVVELAEPDGRATRFGGGWAAYLAERALYRQHAEEDYATYRDKRRTLGERARRQRDWAVQGTKRARTRPADGDKNIRQFKIAQTEKLAAKARATDRAAERLEVVDKPWEGWRLELTFAEAPRAGAVVARLEGAVVERAGFRLGPVDLEIGWGERVALAGPNGCGKTTLLGALLGRVPLAAGRRWLGPGVVVGELDQARRTFSDPARTLLDVFTETTGQRLSEARTLLAKFGLGADHVGRPAASLSPGERTRASLAAFQAAGTNTAVLDEPTNHLDLPAIEQLEAALESFAGTVIVVSHDRAFLDALALTRVVTLGRSPGPSGTTSAAVIEDVATSPERAR